MTKLIPTTLPDSAPDNLLLWADCEFTGIDLADGHKIIEIGALVTDLALSELDSYESFIRYDWQTVQDLMAQNPWWTGKHEEQERMRVGMSGPHAASPEAVDTDLADLVQHYFSDSKPSLCGNSIGNDKNHIDSQLPLFSETLHYRVIDISSLKLIARKYKDIEYTDKKYSHHAMEDIRESIDEFRFILKNFGIADPAQFLTSNPRQ